MTSSLGYVEPLLFLKRTQFIITSKMETSAVEFEGKTYNKITEGQATVLIPSENEVFYNPIQQFNRDMSIAAIRTWQKINADELQNNEKLKRKALKGFESSSSKGIKILEALAASGLRSLRYVKEIDNIDYILANDLSEEAVESISRNSKYNGIPEGKLRANQGDALDVLYSNRKPENQFDIIDIDPYGSAAPFIDASVQAVKSGGLLCVTCTDMAVLASNNHPETCFAKYGGVSVRSEFCHELALRLLLNAIQTSATRYQRHIVPMMSCSIDFYIRVFVRVYDSPVGAKDSIVNTGIVLNCNGCSSFKYQALGTKTCNKNNFKYHSATGPNLNSVCEICSSKLTVAGPCWISSIHNTSFAKQMYELVSESENKFFTKKRMMGMIKVIEEELEIPFHYTLSALCSAVKSGCPPIIKICSAILNAGYKVSSAHSCQCSIKTDAPTNIIWDIIRAHVNSVGKSKKIEENSISCKILSVESSTAVDFTIRKEANPESRKCKLVRYQVNPEKFWGPKSRHKTVKRKANMADLDRPQLFEKVRASPISRKEAVHQLEVFLSSSAAQTVPSGITTQLTKISKAFTESN
ncbi:hypothetical protein BB561_005856 [Smittium simulii]|uniref:tRNA (guanine(26)-N(2))-dimethyltransferase n=1 Tax=Smittium simulii TaxID=133385 RepID=A0A2T9Y810_9FUNG|nr:hypothetical protein BB561_005856 [Smittium simulii]